MTTYQDQRSAALKSARDTIDAAKAAGRDMTPAETSRVRSYFDEIKALDVQIKRVDDSQALIKSIGDAGKQLGGDGQDSARTGFLRLKSGDVARRLVRAQSGVDGAKALASGVTTTTVTLDPAVVAMGTPAGSILDVMPSQVRSTPGYIYLRQSVRTNNAAVVAAGALKPTSVYSIVPVSGQLVVIAHLSEPMDEYMLTDNTMLVSFIDAELGYGLRAAIEAKIVADLTGTSGIQTQAFATDLLTTSRSAITKLETMGSTPGYWIFTPADWQTLELTKASGTGDFQMGPGLPVDRAARRLWGLPVVVNQALAAATAWLVATDAASLSTDGGVSLKWGAPADGFNKNLVTARCEMRVNTDVERPFGVCKLALA